MNYDKTIYREALTSTGAHYGWIYLGSAGGALSLGGGPGVATALNFDRTVWASGGDDVNTFPTQVWTQHGSESNALRITGSLSKHYVGRFYALNKDGTISFNDDLVLASPGTWQSFPLGLPSGVTPIEITSAGRGMIYVLDSTAHLWTAKTNALPVPIYGQEQTNWCWAASTQMIAAYNGIKIKQCDLANAHTGRTDCCTSWFAAGNTRMCNVEGSFMLTDLGLTDFETTGSALDFESLYVNIQKNMPEGFSWHWNSGGGHLMVTVGAKHINNVQWVTVNNPEPVGVGDQYDQLYTDWVSGPTYTHSSDHAYVYWP
jgi:hypothetical protein